jgi:hypothetical protein
MNKRKLQKQMDRAGIVARVSARGIRVELPDGTRGRFTDEELAVKFIKRQCKSLVK